MIVAAAVAANVAVMLLAAAQHHQLFLQQPAASVICRYAVLFSALSNIGINYYVDFRPIDIT